MKEKELFPIEGIVKDQEGEALENISVIISSSPLPQPDIASITNEKGEFSLGSNPKGKYVLKLISEETSKEVPVTLPIEENKIIIVFP